MRGLLDNAGAAEFLGVSLAELKTLRLRRMIPVVRLGRRTLRYRPADLESFIARVRVPALWEKQPGAILKR